MEKSRIYLSSPHMAGSEKKFVNEAFETNWIAPLGPHVTGFENDLSNYLSTKNEQIHVAALSSGTAAIHLALVLLNVGHGDEVICQSMTFSASANPIVYQGATPIFVDSEPESWNICPILLKTAIVDRIQKGKKPKAIIAVHLYGMPYKVEAIRAIADQFEIPIIEDSAEALGSSYKGEKCGTFGDISILSFNGNKIITTSGGGALVSKNKIVKEKAIFLATQARDEAPHYQHSKIGYNYRMSNVCAGIGRGQMEVLDDFVLKRRQNHQFYSKIFDTLEGVEVFKERQEHIFSNHWLSCILIDSKKSNGVTNQQLRLAFQDENIESRPLWKPMHLQPVFAHAPFYGNNTAEQLFDIGLCLPSASNLTHQERSRIEGVINFVFKLN